MKILQINTVVNSGSTGRIAENIGQVLIAKGHESYIAYGRGNGISKSELIKIGNKKDMYFHGLKSLLLDRHGFSSTRSTIELVREIEKIKPDAIGLHNLHGYYLNLEILFDYLKATQIPVVWTLHDCWSFTGHCTYFDRISCEKWKTACFDCDLKRSYPSSLLLDNSWRNFIEKKKLFIGLQNLTLVACSHWLENLLTDSFLFEYPIQTIHNGIDLNIFTPKNNENIRCKLNIDDDNKIILGCANIWSDRKGLSDFYFLRDKLSSSHKIILVGLSKKQISKLPYGIIGIEKTRNTEELASLYSASDVFVNPTIVDNFPTTNIEALACGVPVVTYDTGGSGEAIDECTGIVVEKRNRELLYKAVMEVLDNGKSYYSSACLNRAKQLFNKDDRYSDYVDIYNQKVNQRN